MSQKELFSENRIFAGSIFDPARKGVQFNCWLDSVFMPGFVGRSSGGRYAQYTLVLSGSSRISAGGGEFCISAGHFYISLARRMYDWIKVDSDVPQERVCFSVHHSDFHDQLVREFFPERHIDITLSDPAKVQFIMQKIKSAFQSDRSGGVLAGLQMELLHELYYQHHRRRPELLDDILYYIDSNLHDPQLCREAVGLKFNISVRTLSRLFKKHLGVSPGRHIISSRMKLLKNRLKTEEITLKEAAGSCGFASVNFMVRQFHKYYGETPGQYRKNLISKSCG